MGDIAHLKWLLDKQLQWIAAADSKLTVLGPLPLAMLTFSFSQTTRDVVSITWNDAALVVSTVLLSICLFFAKTALIPRLKGPINSNVFFGKIAEQSESAFFEVMKSADKSEIEEDLMQQVHRNACIANVKHTNIGRSVLFLTLATLFWLLTILTGA